MERRSRPESPVYFPDWFLSRELARDLRELLVKHARGRMLDVGAGRAPYRALLEGRVDEYVTLDTAPAPGIDVVGSALELPFGEAEFDVVFSSQVLEHVPDAQKMFSELRRVVRPGGIVVISVPQYWPEHESPFDFRRFTIHGLRELGRSFGLETIEERRQGGGFSVALQAINNVLAERLHFGDESVPRARKFALAMVLFPTFALLNLLFLLLDRALPSRDDTLNHTVVFRRTQ